MKPSHALLLSFLAALVVVGTGASLCVGPAGIALDNVLAVLS